MEKKVKTEIQMKINTEKKAIISIGNIYRANITQKLEQKKNI